MFAGKANFNSLCCKLHDWRPFSFYESTFVLSIIDQFLGPLRNAILLKFALPEILAAVCFVAFSWESLKKDSTILQREEWDSELIALKCFGIFTVLFHYFLIWNSWGQKHS